MLRAVSTREQQASERGLVLPCLEQIDLEAAIFIAPEFGNSQRQISI
jgi:hypothetical protein